MEVGERLFTAADVCIYDEASVCVLCTVLDTPKTLCIV